jgi:uncharacterized protein (DUF433 family)
MTDQELRERITIDPKVMGGKPCVRGTRLTVRLIVNLLAHGAPLEEIFEDYPHLTHEDISACLLYAADLLDRKTSDELFDSDLFVTIADVPG